ncbi:hypothetical protein Q5752_004749 [Cryptotrichosporon argae]
MSSHEHHQEDSPLLPTSQAETSSRIGWARSVPSLDMIPTTKDKVSLALIGLGLALFVPLTWSLVLTGNLRAMGWFAPHPPLQSLALAFFVLGVTPLQPPPPAGGLTAPTRAARLRTHQTLLLGVAVPALALGTASMWWNKHVHGAHHFTTWHAKFGLASVAWVVVQAGIGAASVWCGGKAFGGGDKAKRVYKYHRISGYALITLFTITAFLAGAYSDWAIGRGKTFVPARVAAFYVGLPLIWLGAIMRIRASKMKVL